MAPERQVLRTIGVGTVPAYVDAQVSFVPFRRDRAVHVTSPAQEGTSVFCLARGLASLQRTVRRKTPVRQAGVHHQAEVPDALSGCLSGLISHVSRVQTPFVVKRKKTQCRNSPRGPDWPLFWTEMPPGAVVGRYASI